MTESSGSYSRSLARMLLVPILIAGAAACLVYAAGFHKTTVLTESALEEPAPPAGEAQPGIFKMTPAAPEPATQLVELELSEPAVIQDITVGGLTRAADGRVKRTYSGDTPTACPT